MQRGVDDALQAGIPLAICQQQTEVEQPGEDDSMLVVGSKKRRKGEFAFKIRHKNILGFGVPLVPERQVAPEFSDDKQLGSKNN